MAGVGAAERIIGLGKNVPVLVTSIVSPHPKRLKPLLAFLLGGVAQLAGKLVKLAPLVAG